MRRRGRRNSVFRRCIAGSRVEMSFAGGVRQGVSGNRLGFSAKRTFAGKYLLSRDRICPDGQNGRTSRQLIDLSLDRFLDNGLGGFIGAAGAAFPADGQRDGYPAEHVSLAGPLVERDFLHFTDYYPAIADVTNASIVRARHSPRPTFEEDLLSKKTCFRRKPAFEDLLFA